MKYDNAIQPLIVNDNINVITTTTKDTHNTIIRVKVTNATYKYL